MASSAPRLGGLTLLFLTACAPAGPVVGAVEHLGPLPQSADIQGRDGGTSSLLWGHSVWTFGDTVLDVADEDGQNWHHNSVGWTRDTEGRDGVDLLEHPVDGAGAPRHLLPPTPFEHAFNLNHLGEDCEEPCGARWATWPGQPVWVEARQQAMFFYGLIYAEPGAYNFEGHGTSLATWDQLDAVPQRLTVNPDAEHPDLLWGRGAPGWGIGPNVVDDHLYTFACEQRGLGRPCFLARAPVRTLHEASAWTYRSASGWSAQVDDAVGVFEGAPIMSVAWHAGLGAWLAVYSEPFAEEVVARTAPALWGPWSAPTTLFREPSVPYDAVHHTEYDEDGAIYISYSEPIADTWFGTTLAWVRVELAAP